MLMTHVPRSRTFAIFTTPDERPDYRREYAAGDTEFEFATALIQSQPMLDL
jgi:hypothetical protein